VPEAGKQKKIPKDSSRRLIYLKKIEAVEGIRTLDPDLGKARNGAELLMARNCWLNAIDPSEAFRSHRECRSRIA
jgi:hypothetical protein